MKMYKIPDLTILTPCNNSVPESKTCHETVVKLKRSPRLPLNNVQFSINLSQILFTALHLPRFFHRISTRGSVTTNRSLAELEVVGTDRCHVIQDVLGHGESYFTS